MQADRICHELFEQFSESLFYKIDLKQYEAEDVSLEEFENNAFLQMLKRDQVCAEVEKETSIFSRRCNKR